MHYNYFSETGRVQFVKSYYFKLKSDDSIRISVERVQALKGQFTVKLMSHNAPLISDHFIDSSDIEDQTIEFLKNERQKTFKVEPILPNNQSSFKIELMKPSNGFEIGKINKIEVFNVGTLSIIMYFFSKMQRNDFFISISIECCSKILVSLLDEPEHKRTYAGEYIMQPELSNRHRVWKSDQGYAIWHSTMSRNWWYLGRSKYLGSTRGNLYSQVKDSSKKCPYDQKKWFELRRGLRRFLRKSKIKLQCSFN